MNHWSGQHIGRQRHRQVGSRYEGRLRGKRELGDETFGGPLGCMWAWRCHICACHSPS